MDIQGLIGHYSAYDRWANQRFIARLEREPEAMLDATVRSSFPSLRATFMHIRNAEATWLARITGAPVRWPAEDHSDLGSVMVHVERLHTHVQALAEEDLLIAHTYADLKGNRHTQPTWQILMHCFNHSTYHRGQLVTMMRALELQDIPHTDLVVYQRTLAALS